MEYRTARMKDFLTRARYAAASPFSRSFSAKRRWLAEREDWEGLGIAQTAMRRKVYVVPRTGAVCIAVSKCANTTLKYMLYPEGKVEPRGVHADDHLLTRLIDAGLTLNDLLDGSRGVFTFVRHPVSRFWSCYTTRIHNADPRSRMVAKIARHMGIEPRSDFSPELVLDYVRSQSPVVVDEHLRPLWSCTGIEKLPTTFVGRIETMAQDLGRLLDMGYFDKGHLSRFRHLNQSAKTELPGQARIDPKIREVYAKDMELFGYD